jgi:hypothetical protein
MTVLARAQAELQELSPGLSQFGVEAGILNEESANAAGTAQVTIRKFLSRLRAKRLQLKLSQVAHFILCTSTPDCLCNPARGSRESKNCLG